MWNFYNKLIEKLKSRIKDFLLDLEFVNYWSYYIHGPKNRLVVGNNCSLAQLSE